MRKSLTQSGTKVPITPATGTVVWTGSNTSETVRVFGTTNNGLGGTTQSFAVIGVTNLSTSNWIFSFTSARGNARRLYGMSSVLTKPTPPVLEVPERSSLLGFITLGGLMLGGTVRKGRK
jgi:hypothetical protein